MTISALQNTLQTMQSVATQAAGVKATGTMVQSAGESGFAGELRDSIRRINEAQAGSAAKAKAFQLGDPTVALNDVMVDMQKAGIQFQMGVQVRNKLVTAYKEVMNMAV
ncbi:flagellar hook-basal body complex protein FliE [Pseudomonas putida]|uniref:Flagellar hook-basal body complex protein FliE n=1 Tax=Pseudomonas putida TaxID=303 RepID=A0A8I1E9Y9_PSEPU|nr:flagellar hook-basal body complex protein FliE [Pseudomonas putida]MBI6882540.1 flagellar hook-basal body complex protein FliE [Pseudomonas putida]